MKKGNWKVTVNLCKMAGEKQSKSHVGPILSMFCPVDHLRCNFLYFQVLSSEKQKISSHQLFRLVSMFPSFDRDSKAKITKSNKKGDSSSFGQANVGQNPAELGHSELCRS